MSTALLLAASLAVQQPELRDAESVTRLLASLRTADPAICQLAARSIINFGGRWDGDIAMPMPMPMPMPRAGGVRIPGPRVGRERDRGPETAALAVFRTTLRDASHCVRHLSAQVIARARPAWAADEFTALAKDAEAGFRETGLLGLGELEDPQTLPVVTAALGDKDAAVRAMAAWALGQIESAEALPALEAAQNDGSPAVRRAVKWAIARIDDRR